MSSHSHPDWFVADDVAATIRNARSTDTDDEKIVAVLCETALDSLPKARVEAIVSATPDNDTALEGVELPLSQPPSTDESPRESPSRRMTVGDVNYLSDREFARVVGLALEQFDGKTVRPPANADLDVDLYWNRQYVTVGIRTVSTGGRALGSEQVESVLNGDVASDVTRSPSELAVVTDGRFEDRATALAIENDVHLVDGGQLETWLRRTMFPPAVIGTVLEDGENHDGPLTDLVELEEMPSPRQITDPLEVDRAFDISELDKPEQVDRSTSEAGEGTDQSATEEEKTSQGDPLRDDEPSPCERGTLYANPAEDGDYGAFDSFLRGIGSSDESSTKTSDDETPETTDNDDEIERTDGPEQDVDRLEIILDLLEIKHEVGEPVSPADVESHGSYTTETYAGEFGSVTDALASADIEIEGDQS